MAGRHGERRQNPRDAAGRVKSPDALQHGLPHHSQHDLQLGSQHSLKHGLQHGSPNESRDA
jgi:hypothetical protein